MRKGRYLVTGAGGFVGSALCRRLLAHGSKVVALGRRDYPELAALGVTTVRANLVDLRPPYPAELCGLDGVFHAAAKVEMWGPWNDFFATNVLGTRNVIELCKQQRIRNLVFTSSPSVIANGSDLRGVDESFPYPARYQAFYPHTKALAEMELLKANCDSLRTVALRPHLIFGPGDQHLLPTVVSKARAGRLPIVGAGKNLSDFTFIDDCVQAHLLAMKAIDDLSEARGRAFFISQGEPYPLWVWIAKVLEASNIAPLTRRVPKFLASIAASSCETAWKLLRMSSEPPLTRFLVSEMATDHYFSIEAARRLLGYNPSCSVDQALEKTLTRKSQ